ncbi:MAG TPA: hypothetical protein VK797_23195 [Tepidisphaeraceae bacterium]|nr:hypothetical protein [Tepidisphaeraceae bacterium]
MSAVVFANMLPTRRTILGAAGASALSRILLPWRPQPQDLIVPGNDIERVEPTLTPLSPGDPRVIAQFVIALGSNFRYVPMPGNELNHVTEIFVAANEHAMHFGLIGRRD